MDRPEPIPVLFIGGEGRSGSTILEMALSALPHTVGLGEVAWLFELGLDPRAECGCGRPVLECPFWAEVGDRLAGGWDTAEAANIKRVFDRIARDKSVPAQLLGNSAFAHEASSMMARVYRTLYEVGGGAMLIDASKHPAWALALRRCPDLDLRVIHLVRHPAAVAYSWSRKVTRSKIGGAGVMPRFPPWRTAVRWAVWNEVFEWMGDHGTPTSLVRYEDYVADPSAVLLRSMHGLGILIDPDDAGGGPGGVSHGIGGNPARFAPAGAALIHDDRWQELLPSRQHHLVSLISTPTRRRYGYGWTKSA